MESYFVIKKQREQIIAPVDTMGCYALGKNHTGDTKKFIILIGLLFSSQTKDDVTYNAVENLKKLLIEITPENILRCPKEKIHECISKIGYHNKKLEYLIEISKKVIKKMPDTLEEVLSLPGIGKKMAYLYMYHALGKNIGIGVDTHVHRISNRINLVKTKTPEQTRIELEKIFDVNEYHVVNSTLVGFGQTICLPTRPKCKECKLYLSCTSSNYFDKK